MPREEAVRVASTVGHAQAVGDRANTGGYLAIDRWDNTDPLTAEEEKELPQQFRWER